MREYDVQLKNKLSLPKGYIDIPENEMSDICGGVSWNYNSINWQFSLTKQECLNIIDTLDTVGYLADAITLVCAFSGTGAPVAIISECVSSLAALGATAFVNGGNANGMYIRKMQGIVRWGVLR